MSVVDPIEAIGGVSNKRKVADPTPARLDPKKSKESDFLFNFNYVIAVMNLTRVCMQHQQEIVAIRSKLADLTTKIQSDLNILNQSMTSFENNAQPSDGNQTFNYYNGFGTDGKFLNIDASGNVTASDALKSGTTAELNAFNELFRLAPGSTSTDVKLSDLDTIEDPTDPSKSFNLNKFWFAVRDSYSAKGFPGIITPDDGGFGSPSNDRPSLIMQYTYWQAKLNLYQTSPDDIKAAGGDFTKLPGMNFSPSDPSFDANINNMLTVYTALNENADANNDALGTWGTGGATYLQLLDNATHNPSTLENLYLGDMHLAFKYFWTKDPQAKDSIGTQNRAKGADTLSDAYGKISSTQASLSSASSAQGTNFQQDTSGMTTETNEVQQIISSFMQGQGSLVGNFKSG